MAYLWHSRPMQTDSSHQSESAPAAQNYFRLRLNNVTKDIDDQVSFYCFSNGALGLSEVLGFSQPDLTYDPRILERSNHDLDVYFESEPNGDFYKNFREKFPTVSLEAHTEENKDWLAEWKKGFEAFKLVGPAWVVPSWLKLPEAAGENAIEIKIDPGMAFGTGTHATTKMASFFIYKLAQDYVREIPNWTMLDVGTGTAILAMLAEKLDYGLITGIEIDPEARRKARENCALNETENIEISELQLDELRETYDVVVANIIDGVLIRIKKDLVKRVKIGGHLFLTGILQERDNLFFAKFIESDPDLKVVKRIQKDEWVGYWVQKNAPVLDQ